jgi:hypothetical protein
VPVCDCYQRPFDNIEEFSDAVVDRVFTQAADKVFQTLGPSCPAFTALLFRAQEDDHHSADYLFAYSRSVKIDESGSVSYGAVAVDPHVLKYYEPHSDILDMDEREVTTNAQARAHYSCECPDRNSDDGV